MRTIIHSCIITGIFNIIKKGVVIINTSVVPHGGTFPVYGDKGGGEDLKKAGVIFSRYLRADKAGLLIMLSLPYVGKDLEKLQEIFDLPK